MKILEKVLVSVLSTLILSLLLAIIVYTPEVERMANVYYEPFYGLFIIYFIYSLPVYVVGGVLYSFIVDKSLNRIQFQNKLPKYFTQFFSLYLRGNHRNGYIFSNPSFGDKSKLLWWKINNVWFSRNYDILVITRCYSVFTIFPYFNCS